MKTKRITLDGLRDCIAEAIAKHVKAYNVPGFCSTIGLEPGDGSEAHRSKRLYVKNRLLALQESELLRISADALKQIDDAALEDMLSEMTTHAKNRITEISRREVLKALNPLDTLFGDMDLFDGLSIVSSESLTRDGLDNYLNFLPSLSKEIDQHYIRNDDYSNEELLIRCGALTCSQSRFFSLIEKLLDPVVRRGDEQEQLASVLKDILSKDGFNVVIIGEQSRHPVYGIKRIAASIAGAPKNLIFAAINAKPDLYFTDAINNNIAIRNQTDALIYDRFLGDSGLLWSTVVDWWKERERLTDLATAKRALYKRLLQSVKEARSPGEFVLFDTYYRKFSPILGDNLPALIPQVYLHYDPKTAKQRGSNPVLLRQRMDLLLLLDQNLRIVIEVDGKQHYSDGDAASPEKYADMVTEDRRLRLAGYELYRFGGAEFKDVTLLDGRYVIGPIATQVAVNFFQQLLDKYQIKSKK